MRHSDTHKGEHCIDKTALSLKKLYWPLRAQVDNRFRLFLPARCHIICRGLRTNNRIV